MAPGLTTLTTHGRMFSFLQEGYQDEQCGGMLLVRFGGSIDSVLV